MELDWSLCVICQRKTSEALKCPLETPVKKGNKIDAYTNFLNHVKQFQDTDSLPVIVKLDVMRLQKTGNFIVRRGISLAVRNLAAANLKEQN